MTFITAITPAVIVVCILILILGLIISYEDHRGLTGWETFWMLVTVIALVYNYRDWINSLVWYEVLGALVGYCIIGAFWAYYKWVVAASKVKLEINELLNKNPERSLESLIRDTSFWSRGMIYSNLYIDENKVKLGKGVSMTLSHNDNKSKVIGWISYWPVSFVCYILADVLKDIGEAIASSIRGILESTSSRLLRDFDNK